MTTDSDLVPPIELLRDIRISQNILVFFSPKRYSTNLNNLADATKKLERAKIFFENSMLPEIITLQSGYVIEKPSKWKYTIIMLLG